MATTETIEELHRNILNIAGLAAAISCIANEHSDFVTGPNAKAGASLVCLFEILEEISERCVLLVDKLQS